MSVSAGPGAGWASALRVGLPTRPQLPDSVLPDVNSVGAVCNSRQEQCWEQTSTSDFHSELLDVEGKVAVKSCVKEGAHRTACFELNFSPALRSDLPLVLPNVRKRIEGAELSLR